jgi:hypothetical protein
MDIPLSHVRLNGKNTRKKKGNRDYKREKYKEKRR